MTANYELVSLFTARATNGTSNVADLGSMTDDVTLEVVTTGSPTFSWQMQCSIDYDATNPGASTWVSLGSAVTAVGNTKLSFATVGPARFFRGVLSSLSGGTFTAKLGFLPGV